MNECESKESARKIDVSDIESCRIDGSKSFVRKVRIFLKSGDVLTFEPYLQTWDKGINAHIREGSAKYIKRVK